MPRKPKRILVREKLGRIFIDGICLDKIQEEIQNFLDEYSSTHEAIYFDPPQNEDYEECHCYFDEVFVCGNRLENDEEYEKRMAKLEKENTKIKVAKEKKEAKERAEYERLKKKFEG